MKGSGHTNSIIGSLNGEEPFGGFCGCSDRLIFLNKRIGVMGAAGM